MLLRAVKREFEFYGIEVIVMLWPRIRGVLHVAGGSTSGYSVERYSVPDDSWEMVRGMKEELDISLF
jgi:hypothetical protein